MTPLRFAGGVQARPALRHLTCSTGPHHPASPGIHATLWFRASQFWLPGCRTRSSASDASAARRAPARLTLQFPALRPRCVCDAIYGVLCPCMTATAPITLSAVPTLFQSIFTCPPPGLAWWRAGQAPSRSVGPVPWQRMTQWDLCPRQVPARPRGGRLVRPAEAGSRRLAAGAGTLPGSSVSRGAGVVVCRLGCARLCSRVGLGTGKRPKRLASSQIRTVTLAVLPCRWLRSLPGVHPVGAMLARQP